MTPTRRSATKRANTSVCLNPRQLKPNVTFLPWDGVTPSSGAPVALAMGFQSDEAGLVYRIIPGS